MASVDNKKNNILIKFAQTEKATGKLGSISMISEVVIDIGTIVYLWCLSCRHWVILRPMPNRAGVLVLFLKFGSFLAVVEKMVGWASHVFIVSFSYHSILMAWASNHKDVSPSAVLPVHTCSRHALQYACLAFSAKNATTVNISPSVYTTFKKLVNVFWIHWLARLVMRLALKNRVATQRHRRNSPPIPHHRFFFFGGW